MNFSNDRLHKCGLWAAVGLIVAALSACAVGDGRQQGAPPFLHSLDTIDGTTSAGEPGQGQGNGAAGDSQTGALGGVGQGNANRTVTALNNISLTLKSR